ncbi:MAG: mechanosensitive ion channel [Lentisphaeria bacterium]|nr:mechanosensitive ion channel [Lentisphaeria bacterium]
MTEFDRYFILLGVSILTYSLTRWVIKPIVSKTKNDYDDLLFTPFALGIYSILIPLIVGAVLFHQDVMGMKSGKILLERSYFAVITIIVAALIHNYLNTTVEIYNRFKISRHRPIKGYFQLFVMITWFIATVIIISIVSGRSPLALIAGLGAVSAVLLLVFKDTIMSLVASFQLSMNNMIQIGDWIVVDGKCDGDVIDITLHTVKVQNWDKTISTVPTHSLIADSFVNWRGMSESGGRRIKRAVNIDIGTIRFLTDEEIDHLKEFDLLDVYFKQKLEDLEKTNKVIDTTHKSGINKRRLSNIGTFRAYLEAYLTAHPQISDELTFLVRQLPTTAEGVPMEIYVFSTNKVWAEYEAIQSDIFDHIMAIIPEFGLKIFQKPAGSDIQKLTQN